MNSPVLLLTLILTVKPVTVSMQACPAGTTSVSPIVAPATSWCISHYTNMVTFCDAVKTCHSTGQEMISKPVFDAMKESPNFPGSGANDWWVGLVDAANERGTSTSGWVWMKEGQETTGADGYFNTGEPNVSDGQDCVSTDTFDKLLRDARCSELRPFYCFSDPPGPVQTAGPRTFQFKNVQILHYSQPDDGCWIRLSKVSDVFDCTNKCSIFGADCVGFYWNPARQECIILPYFDAAVPLDFGTEWERLQWKKFLHTG